MYGRMNVWQNVENGSMKVWLNTGRDRTAGEHNVYELAFPSL